MWIKLSQSMHIMRIPTIINDFKPWKWKSKVSNSTEKEFKTGLNSITIQTFVNIKSQNLG